MPGVHLEVPNPQTVSRNDSFKSDRSDKRVSFNHDVGVKRIPRGQKHSSNYHSNKLPKDEWSKCAPVHLEKPKLSSTELERQAEDLVRLIDEVDCVSSSQPLAHQSSSRSKNNKTISKDGNNKPLNNRNQRKYNNFNGIDNRAFNNSRTRNPIRSISKENVNINNNNNRGRLNSKERPFMRRSLSAHHSSNDINDSDTDNTYEKYSATYKSVPDIPATLHYDNYNKPYQRYNHLINHDIGESKNFVSVDNIYNEKHNRLKDKANKNRNGYKSVDNLTDVSIPGNRKLHEYKSVENLQSGYSSSANEFEMTGNYRPKVGNIIQKFNSGAEEKREIIHNIMLEEPSSPRGYREPDEYISHNRNKPFSYTGASMSSVEAVRRLSPARETAPVLNSKPVYAQVNKNDRRITRSTSRESERNIRNGNADFSAKIIITNNEPSSRRYDDDDHAYETYQVGENNFTNKIKQFNYSSEDIIEDYKGYNNNNNMNMSSVGVQTDGLHKGPSRPRKNANSPSRYDNGRKEGFNNDLSSASLVRRINHGFGKTDRSPSPPPRVVASQRKMPRNVVPLLSDTEDSEFHYRGRRDPMARIRDQVMIREKLHEEREAEERENREAMMFLRKPKSLDDLDSTQMQPLTVDDVGALTLEVDKRGRNTLIVSRQGQSNSTSRITNDCQSQRTNSNMERVQSAPPPNARKSSSEEYSRDHSPNSRHMSTIERMKHAIEKGKSSLDRKDQKLKEEKKKKIKIKFYYDPKRGNPDDDPLNKYTEYKGTSSDDRSSPTNRYKDYASDTYDDYYRDSKNELRDDFHNSLLHDDYLEKGSYPSRREKSVERGPTRPPRHSSRERSVESKERDRSRGSARRESSNERSFRRDNRDSSNSRDNRIKAANRALHSDKNSYDRRGNLQRKSREDIRNDYSNVYRRQEETKYNKYDTTNKYDSDGYRSDLHEVNDYEKSDHAPSLSEKYRSLTRHSTPPRDRPKQRNDAPSSHKEPQFIEDDEKQQKILRQRKKFFGVLLGDGRTKSKSPKGESSTLPRTNQKTTNINSSSNTLQRVQETKHERQSSFKEKHPPTIIKEEPDSRSFISRDREADNREKQQWENAIHSREDSKKREKNHITITNINNRKSALKDSKYSADSSPSSTATPVGRTGQIRTGRNPSFQQRYFGDTDTENSRNPVGLNSGGGDYRSLPTRKTRSTGSRMNVGRRMRGISPGARGSAGSSLQSSESEADSHGGSHASRQSRASHVSTGSNRSVYLHATAVADIPVRRNSDEAPSEKGISRQSKKVSRSFSLLSPWKPRNYRERYEVEYDNREVREAREGRGGKSALPPRPPRKQIDIHDSNKIGRSQTVYKDSKLTGWLKRRKNKDVKGI